MKALAVGLAASMLITQQAQGGAPSLVIANYVNEACKAENADCSDYLLGVKEGLAFSAHGKVCFVNADAHQLRLAFLLYASQHPDELAGPAAKMASEAFATSFMCPRG